MTRNKYRLAVLTAFLVSLACFIVFGYLALQRRIPDRIIVETGDEAPKLVSAPLDSLISEEVVQASAVQASNIPSGSLEKSTDGDYAIACSLFGVVPLKTVDVTEQNRVQLYPMGMPVGIYLKTEGVLVVGTAAIDGIDGSSYEPAKNIVQSGDYILRVDGKTVGTKEELAECISCCGGATLDLQVMRKSEVIDLAVTPVQTAENKYQAGIWVRNDTQGIGTMTYLDEDGSFGALGHGISDVDTSTLLTLKSGTLYKADILSIVKGAAGQPGELAGVIHYNDESVLGEITKNETNGIYGTVYSSAFFEDGQETLPVAYKQEIHEGTATVICCLDGTRQEYEIEIEEINLNSGDVNKGMVIRITDPRLLELTGGIVQGMSGSPIIQNGRIVGAVTHVFVNDPTKGYGIFMENMLEQ